MLPATLRRASSEYQLPQLSFLCSSSLNPLLTLSTPSPSPPSLLLRTFIFIGTAALTVAFLIGFYCVVWLRHVQGTSWPWQIVAPGMVEVATLSGVVSFLAFVAGLWPAYGLLTPLLVGILAMGLMFSLHFLPPF